MPSDITSTHRYTDDSVIGCDANVAPPNADDDDIDTLTPLRLNIFFILLIIPMYYQIKRA